MECVRLLDRKSSIRFPMGGSVRAGQDAVSHEPGRFAASCGLPPTLADIGVERGRPGSGTGHETAARESFAGRAHEHASSEEQRLAVRG